MFEVNPMQWIRSQPRVVWLLLACGLVWMQAANISDFFQGVLDGFAAAQPPH
jgi:hypothetical protein